MTCTEKIVKDNFYTLSIIFCLQSLDTRCHIYKNGAYNGQVFLKNEDNDLLNSSGILEFHYKNEWHPVCVSGSFTQIATDVVCRQLGYTGSVKQTSKYISN